MTNAEMIAGRFYRLQNARRLFAAIDARLADANGAVVVATYTKATVYKAKHRGMFMLANGAVLVQRGKTWDCITGGDGKAIAGVKFGRYE